MPSTSPAPRIHKAATAQLWLLERGGDPAMLVVPSPPRFRAVAATLVAAHQLAAAREAVVSVDRGALERSSFFEWLKGTWWVKTCSA
ncbi:hypothetical protein [Arthrobacter pascens]|uniref:hypothetical protein n=1 Tax=Arthrobacter pascens TaxID=1677 RepID=UPI0027D87B6C|nr:hypothetical protein [Arthrobacter pascens]